jgi:serine/threonine-protein kinase
VSFDPAQEARPHWNRDGHAITFVSNRAEVGVYQRRADGLGSDSLLAKGMFDEAVPSPDGAWLVLRSTSLNSSLPGGRDITSVRLGADTVRTPLIVTSFDEEAIALSPDSKWIAYQSDETGRTEVYVRSFSNPGAFKHQVSNGGGAAPLWSRNGHELFFVSKSKDMMSARVVAGAPITLAAPVPLFHIPDDLLQVDYAFYTPWDVAADGRFIMARKRNMGNTNASTAFVAENWLTELRARVKR